MSGSNPRERIGQAADAMKNFALLPPEGVNAVFGAPQRVVASRISHLGSNPRGVAGATAATLGNPWALVDPKTREQLGNEAYAVFHPNDPSIEDNAERAAGVNRLMTNDPRFRGKLRNFLIRTTFENVTDPLNFATLGTAAAGEDAIRAISRMGTSALRHPNKAVRNLAQNILTTPAERAAGESPQNIARINSVKQAEITRSRVQHSADAELLHSIRGDLHNGVVPPVLRQRFLREAYLEGTPEMRQQAISFGFRPSAQEAATKPRGLLDYNLRENYDPHTGEFKAPPGFDDLLLGEEERLRDPRAGFEERQSGEVDPGTLYDRVERRLAQGRAVVRHRATVEGLQRHAGMSPEMARATATESKLGGIEALKSLSRAQVDALLSTGLPHMKNVAVGGYLSMGETGLAQAARYFLGGVPQHLSERLSEGGASHFGIRVPGKWSPARLMPHKLRQGSTTLLDRWDTALRAARLEQVDKEMRGADELEKLDRVNQDLGAYNLKPQYVRWLQAFGANFPQWHNYIVPTMVGRAALRRPDRIERLGRTEQNANDAFLPNASYRMTLGGPLDEASSASADPARFWFGADAAHRYPSYFGGQSSIGPAATAMHSILYGPKKEIPLALADLVPFGSMAYSLIANPFDSPLAPYARAAAELFGSYPQKRTEGSLNRTSQP